MRKQIEETNTRTVTLCDHCGKDASGGFSDTCWLCRSEVCIACRSLLFTASGGAAGNDWLVEFAIHVCKRCQTGHGDIIEKIEAVLAGANHQLREWLALWQQAVKGKGQPPCPTP